MASDSNNLASAVRESFKSEDSVNSDRLVGVGVYKGHSRTYLEVESHSAGYRSLFNELAALSYLADDYDTPIRLCFIQNGRSENRACRLSLGTYEGMSWERRRGQIPQDVRFVE